MAKFSPEEKSSHELIKVSQPTTCIVTQEKGTIKVKGWDKQAISIDIIQKGTPDELENTNIIIDKNKLPHEISCIVQQKNNEKQQCAHVSLVARVPTKTDVILQSHKGSVKTKNIEGAQSIQADHGDVTIHLKKFTVESSLFVHAKKGTIILETAKKTQANLSASTQRGTITSDLLVTLQPHTTLLNREYWYQIRKDIHGFLGEGGAPITLENEMGDIKIRVAQ